MLIETVNDIFDPWDVFLSVSDKSHPFIFDTLGLERFSIVGSDPFIVIKAWQNNIEIISNNTKEVKTDSPFSFLDSILSRCKEYPENLPCGGAVGYFGYDLKSLPELKLFRARPELDSGTSLENLPKKTSDTPHIPDMLMGIYDTIFVYDHFEHRGYIISTGMPEQKEDDRQTRAEKRLREFKTALQNSDKNIDLAKIPLFGKTSSNFTRDEYLSSIKKTKSYISSGDIYQINLSQRFKIPFKGDPKAFYSKLRRINPVPFGAFIDYGEFQIISNSPECFLKIQNGTIETYPIKGTSPRGKNPAEDEILIKGLKTNAKELAEHIMIVDLERNDIGKVCKTGTVKVKELEKIVSYPTLHHMVSCVTGKIKNNISPIDCIKACFPGGSITGAPKIRAMEIIDELEPAPRGIYTGAIGYIDFSGNVNLGMAIRTAVVSNNEMQLSVGGGIVADSVPEAEYEETLLKAEAFFRAMKRSRQ